MRVKYNNSFITPQLLIIIDGNNLKSNLTNHLCNHCTVNRSKSLHQPLKMCLHVYLSGCPAIWDMQKLKVFFFSTGSSFLFKY